MSGAAQHTAAVLRQPALIDSGVAKQPMLFRADSQRAGNSRRELVRFAFSPAENRDQVHLYRIMTEVHAGLGQENCVPGQRGLATLWVQSDSEEDALRQALTIIESRDYQSVGELTAYLEDTHGSSTTGAGEEDPLAAGYSSMKENAIGRGDGLFELWFPKS